MIDKATADKARAELDHALRAFDEVRDSEGFKAVGYTLFRRGKWRNPGANWAARALDTSLVIALRTMARHSLDNVYDGEDRARCIRIVKRVAPTVLDTMLEDADRDAGC